MTAQTRGMEARGTEEGLKVRCTVDLEQTPDSLHAYVDLEGIKVGAGDTVIVHDAPDMVGFGEKLFVERHATVIRASAIERVMAHIEGYLELTELYEVSFSPGRVS
jgi:hypothetical protein